MQKNAKSFYNWAKLPVLNIYFWFQVSNFIAYLTVKRKLNKFTMLLQKPLHIAHLLYV